MDELTVKLILFVAFAGGLFLNLGSMSVISFFAGDDAEGRKLLSFSIIVSVIAGLFVFLG